MCSDEDSGLVTMPIIPAHRKLRKKEMEYKVSLRYLARLHHIHTHIKYQVSEPLFEL